MNYLNHLLRSGTTGHVTIHSVYVPVGVICFMCNPFGGSWPEYRPELLGHGRPTRYCSVYSISLHNAPKAPQRDALMTSCGGCFHTQRLSTYHFQPDTHVKTSDPIYSSPIDPQWTPKPPSVLSSPLPKTSADPSKPRRNPPAPFTRRICKQR